MKSGRGATLIETMVTLMVGAVVAAALFQGIGVLAFGWGTATDANNNTARVRTTLDELADHARNAATCGSSSSGVQNSVLDSATSNSFTYYVDNSCTKVKYYLSGTSILRSDSGKITTLATGVTKLNFTYYKATTYNTAWTTTTNPSAPTTAELPYVCGILIDATCTTNGVSNEFTTTVRMRNAPVKGRLDGL